MIPSKDQIKSKRLVTIINRFAYYLVIARWNLIKIALKIKLWTHQVSMREYNSEIIQKAY